MKIRDIVLHESDIPHRAARELLAGYSAEIAGRRRPLDIIIGDYIARGTYREVFAHRFDSGLVAKLDTSKTVHGGIFVSDPEHNESEWRAWQEIRKHPKFVRWFAPCAELLADGQLLLQRRVEPVAGLPAQFPQFFANHDMLEAYNWGLLDSRPVCCDYAAMGDFHDINAWLTDPAETAMTTMAAVRAEQEAEA